MAAAERLRVAIAETGLAFDRLNPPASSDKSLPLGGPFVPVQVAPESSPFTHAFSKVQEAVLATDRLRRIVPYVPLRKPLPARPMSRPALAPALTHSSAAPPCTPESISATITAPSSVRQRRACHNGRMDGRLRQDGRDRPRQRHRHALGASLQHCRAGWADSGCWDRARPHRIVRARHRPAPPL
jgi:hypothetical protein